ncbi:hypothetical protein F8M41_018286 [Gigaspora margarita]|uniref:F-box domain-containing protein n=1 Tax=Gigaspora margarita TaxID=4874 RepID=A0A8H4ALR2_GIGMA|nr:hypothetical protein F8M41_018286 [Gigaspora margarita]
MASKILMNDMPELMENIFKNLNKDIYSLYSCALVSRHWCKMSIPFLWQDPFSFNRRSPLFISNYFSSLGEYEKTILKECLEERGINEEFSKTLFDYARFLKVLELLSLKTLKYQKNSLQEVVIQDCSFSAEYKVLNNCKNLETIRIKCCDTELMKILDYKISTLEVFDTPIDAQTMALILEKAGILLQRLIVESISMYKDILEESLLLETIKSFCPNITYFKIRPTDFSTQLLELIGNLHKLQFFSVRCYINNISVEELKIRVMQFSKILPLTLQYLDLRDIWLEPYIDILLNHCQAPLKKLLIDRLDNEKNTKALIEFCVRTRTLNYVGVYEYSDLDDLDDNIRKEVEANVELVPIHFIDVGC